MSRNINIERMVGDRNIAKRPAVLYCEEEI